MLPTTRGTALAKREAILLWSRNMGHGLQAVWPFFKPHTLIMTFIIGESMRQPHSIRQLKVGDKARITRILADGELGRRIRDMGLVPGAEVEAVGQAPLKDPIALRLKGFTLSLRNNEADFIIVSPLEA